MRVVVTGCSSGIGLETAILLGRRGDQVVAGVRTVDNTGLLASAVKAEALPIEITSLDVTDTMSVAAAVAHAESLLGGIDALVNNAGISQLSAIEDLTDGDAAALIETNYLGPLRMCRAVVPIMRRQGNGRIVNVSSMNGRATFPYAGGYGASKAALEAMSEALALEVGRFGIKVAIAQPGVFDTAIARNSLSRPESRHYVGAVEHFDAARAVAAASAPPVLAAAEAIIGLLDRPDPPLRTPIGRDAGGVLKRREAMDDQAFFAWVRSLDEYVPDSPSQGDIKTDHGA